MIVVRLLVDKVTLWTVSFETAYFVFLQTDNMSASNSDEYVCSSDPTNHVITSHGP